MAWKLHAIEQTQLRRQHRVDGVGRPKFDFHTGLAANKARREKKERDEKAKVKAAADKKAKPVRWLIVVMTSVVAVAAAFLAMLAWDTLQRAQTAS